MNFIEKSGKTVEDAVQAGLKELAKEPSEVTIDVLEYGSPGLFGMFGKLARVRLTVKAQDNDFDFEMPVFSLDQQVAKKPKLKKPEPKQEAKSEAKPDAKPEVKEVKSEAKPEPAAAPRAEAPRPGPEERTAPQEREPAAPRAEDRPGQRMENRPERRPQPAQPKAPRSEDARPARKPRPPRSEAGGAPRAPQMEPATMEDLPPLDMDALSQDGKNAYAFLVELTRLMAVEVEIRIKETEGHLQVQMIGDTLGVLIGRRGDTLDALQYLTSLQVNKGRDEYLRVTLDTEHYRAKREDALKRLAERMANRAKRTGHRVTLEPMNPYERRVLHSALQDHPHVTTHSEGEEPYRRVVITLK